MPSPSSRAAHRLLAEHHVDREVLADVAQEVDDADSSAVQSRLLTSRPCPGERSTNRSSWARDAARRCCATSVAGRQLPLAVAARRVADQPGRAAGERDRPVPGSWNRRSVSSGTGCRRAGCRRWGRSRRRASTGPAARSVAQRVEVGRLGDEAAPGQLVKDVGGHRWHPLAPESAGTRPPSVARGPVIRQSEVYGADVRTVRRHARLAVDPEPPGPVGGLRRYRPAGRGGRRSVWHRLTGPDLIAARRLRHVDAVEGCGRCRVPRVSRAGPRARSRGCSAGGATASDLLTLDDLAGAQQDGRRDVRAARRPGSRRSACRR